MVSYNIGSGFNIGSGWQFSQSLGVITTGLILYVDAGNTSSYPGSGTTWTDLSAAGNNATLNGSTPFNSSGNTSSLTFVSGYAATGAILPAAAYTKIAIFKVSGSYYNIISGGVTSSDHAFWGAGTQYLQSGHNGSWSTISSSVTTPLDQWVFGAVSFNTSTGWRLYLNQNSVVTNSNTSTFSPTPAVVEIGAYQNGTNLNGQVAATLIYNRVLTDAEVSQTYSYYQSRFSLA
jgi:Concanavalin A-like lectin/glucanases superfamily